MLARSLCALALLLDAALVFAAIEDDSAEDWADIIQIELRHGRPLPALSIYDNLNLAGAYEIQSALVRRLTEHGSVTGYKAALTNAEQRQKFLVREPVAGVLIGSGARADGATLHRAAFKRPMVEVNLGFVLRSPVKRRLASVDDLRTYVGDVVPVLEVPDMNYANPGALLAPDLVATNLGASHYVTGARLKLADLAAVNTLTVVLKRDDTKVDEGRAIAAMGNQLEALLWLVNASVDHGWPLRSGQILITGRIGAGVPADAGRWRAEFGEAGSVGFVMTAPPPPADQQIRVAERAPLEPEPVPLDPSKPIPLLVPGSAPVDAGQPVRLLVPEAEAVRFDPNKPIPLLGPDGEPLPTVDPNAPVQLLVPEDEAIKLDPNKPIPLLVPEGQ